MPVGPPRDDPVFDGELFIVTPGEAPKDGAHFTPRTPEFGDAEDVILAGMLLDDPDSAS